ncbi:MAG: peptide chain release factor N(5)-glutamine methyltransferase [Flavobacteriaceae bacterium]|nr:peptide chain release factor N(5)-glutamine methyltransferase [Flavobacteriaceae bacterium]
MTLGELRNVYEQELLGVYERSEIRQHFAQLCEAYFGYQPADVVLALPSRVNDSNETLLLNALKALKDHKPIQYIIGQVLFAKTTLQVNTSVLIPRPETEELVHRVLGEWPNDRNLKVLDIGTGSGCIAIALKHARPSWDVTAWDIDTAALEVAKRNSQINNTTIDFEEMDILRPNLPKKDWDIMVSNPPYVPEQWKKNTKSHVLSQEPNHAIFVPDDSPLLFYIHIAAYAKEQLKPSGQLYLEGHAPFMSDVEMLLKKTGFSDIVIENDFRNNPRFIRATNS